MAKKTDLSATASLLASPAGYATVVSKGAYLVPRHIAYLNTKLVDFAAGRIKRLIVQMPPRHGKSELCSKYFPAWYLGLWPDNRLILASYESRFAEEWGRKTRDLVAEYNSSLFGNALRKDLRTAHHWGIEGHVGEMFTAGAMGPMTGKGANCMVIDDPVKNYEQALSALQRNKLWDWYLSVVRTRLEPGASMMIIMTRWHHDDLVGRLLDPNREDAPQENWDVVSFAAVHDSDTPDALGRQRGEALWPERYTSEELLKQSRSAWWEPLFQQRPTNAEGAIIKDEWLRSYETLATNEGMKLVCDGQVISRASLSVFVTGDLAIREKTHNDCTVFGVWGYHPPSRRVFLLDVVRKRMDAPTQLAELHNLHKRWNPAVIWIESVSYQLALVQFARKSGLPVRELEADGDKVSRLYAASPYFEAGDVWIPAQAPWRAEYKAELLQFPAGAHDDMVDMTSYAVAYACPRGMDSQPADIRARIKPQPFAHAMVNQPARMFA